jgi:hypothetical protein
MMVKGDKENGALFLNSQGGGIFFTLRTYYVRIEKVLCPPLEGAMFSSRIYYIRIYQLGDAGGLHFFIYKCRHHL